MTDKMIKFYAEIKKLLDKRQKDYSKIINIDIDIFGVAIIFENTCYNAMLKSIMELVSEYGFMMYITTDYCGAKPNQFKFMIHD